jgi:hypothetical protein
MHSGRLKRTVRHPNGRQEVKLGSYGGEVEASVGTQGGRSGVKTGGGESGHALYDQNGLNSRRGKWKRAAGA